MILDYAPATGKYVVRVPRNEGALVQTLVKDHGLDVYSGTPGAEVWLTTPHDYAALAYIESATDAARAQLGPLIPELEASYSLGMDRKCDVPDGVDLYPYQKAGVNYVMQRSRALIGDEPGLGKTPMAIVTANEMRAKSVLVVCPANIRLQWAKQIDVWSTMAGRKIIYPILKSSDGVHPNAQWTIISYDLLRNPQIHAALAARKFDFLVIDEAHYLKTVSTGRTKAIFGKEGLAHNVGAVLGLTGTPLPNRPRECYTLARGLCWDAIDFMSQREFDGRFNPVETRTTKDGKKYSYEQKGRLLELQNRLRVNFMIRRKKRDVYDQMPEIRYDVIHVEETGDVRKALEAEKLLEIDPENLQGVDAAILGHISTVRQQMGAAKAPLVADYVAGLIEGGEDKIVVFTWHIEPLDILEKKLSKYGVVRVEGSTSARMRQKAVDDFQGDPGIRVFLGNLMAVGTGTDGLQNVCNRAIFAECSWVPAHNEQGVGRLERIGQKHGILIEFLVAKGSLDERVLGSAIRKMKGIHSSLDERME